MRELPDGTKVLSIGYSPCPNDTYIFDALVNGKIETGEFRFEPVLEDVEQLNLRALRGEYDITKLSFRAYADCDEEYVLCDAGSALGFGVGPLLVAKKSDVDRTTNFEVAIPGAHTTANFLFRMYHPQVTRFKEVLFSEIEDEVVNGTVDAGVIIHENRFTYLQKGLHKLADLGSLWENETGQPIPLGGIALKRNLSAVTREAVNRLIRESVEFANTNPRSSEAYVALHAQAMDPGVRAKHIALYVNDHSIDLGESGRSAVRYFFEKAFRAGVIKKQLPVDLFVSGR